MKAASLLESISSLPLNINNINLCLRSSVFVFDDKTISALQKLTTKWTEINDAGLKDQVGSCCLLLSTKLSTLIFKKASQKSDMYLKYLKLLLYLLSNAAKMGEPDISLKLSFFIASISALKTISAFGRAEELVLLSKCAIFLYQGIAVMFAGLQEKEPSESELLLQCSASALCPSMLTLISHECIPTTQRDGVLLYFIESWLSFIHRANVISLFSSVPIVSIITTSDDILPPTIKGRIISMCSRFALTPSSDARVAQRWIQFAAHTISVPNSSSFVLSISPNLLHKIFLWAFDISNRLQSSAFWKTFAPLLEEENLLVSNSSIEVRIMRWIMHLYVYKKAPEVIDNLESFEVDLSAYCIQSSTSFDIFCKLLTSLTYCPTKRTLAYLSDVVLKLSAFVNRQNGDDLEHQQQQYLRYLFDAAVNIETRLKDATSTPVSSELYFSILQILLIGLQCNVFWRASTEKPSFADNFCTLLDHCLLVLRAGLSSIAASFYSLEPCLPLLTYLSSISFLRKESMISLVTLVELSVSRCLVSQKSSNKMLSSLHALFVALQSSQLLSSVPSKLYLRLLQYATSYYIQRAEGWQDWDAYIVNSDMKMDWLLILLATTSIEGAKEVTGISPSRDTSLVERLKAFPSLLQSNAGVKDVLESYRNLVDSVSLVRGKDANHSSILMELHLMMALASSLRLLNSSPSLLLSYAEIGAAIDTALELLIEPHDTPPGHRSEALIGFILNARLYSLYCLLDIFGRMEGQVQLLTKSLQIALSTEEVSTRTMLLSAISELICCFQIRRLSLNMHTLPDLDLSAPTENADSLSPWISSLLSLVWSGTALRILCDNKESFDHLRHMCNELTKEKKGTAFMRASLCLGLSRLAMCKHDDLSLSLSLAKQAMGLLDRSKVYAALLSLEANILVAECYEQCGFIEGALTYLSDAAYIAKRGSPTMLAAADLHSIRFWHRMSSPRVKESLISIYDEPPFAKGILAESFTSARDAVIQYACNGDAHPLSGADGSFRFMCHLWGGSSALGLASFHTCCACFPSVLLSGASCQTVDVLVPGVMIYQSSKKSGRSCTDALSCVSARCDAFDIIRNLRRRAALDSLHCSLDQLQTFILAASSCGVAYECTTSVQKQEEFKGSPAGWTRLACSGDSSSITEVILLLDALCSSTCNMMTESVVSSAVFEPSLGSLILTRYSRKGGCLSVSLSRKASVEILLETWKCILLRNEAVLKESSNVAAVEEMKDAERKKWWKEREAVDEAIGLAQAELQRLLGPWRCIFATHLVSLNTTKVHAFIEETLTRKAKLNTKNSSDVFTILTNWLSLVLSAMDRQCLSDPLNSEEAVDVLLEAIAANLKLPVDVAVSVAAALLLYASSAPHHAKEGDIEISMTATRVTDSVMKSVSSLKVTELRTKLKAKGVSGVGKKDDLIARLANLMLEEETENRSTQSNSFSQPAANALSSLRKDYSQEKAPTGIYGHCVLILDEQLQCMPWESMPCLRRMRCSRVPGLTLLLTLIQAHSGESQTHYVDVPIAGGWFIVDPENNLPTTREVMTQFLNPLALKFSWDGFVGTIPSKNDFGQKHEVSDLFIYSGHGSGNSACDSYHVRRLRCPLALLWGCSSGRLVAEGVHEPAGMALSYLIGGAPSVVGNLWDVTDRDLDRLSIHCMEAAFEDGADHRIDIASALFASRNICKMRNAVGSAAVLYGMPSRFFEQHSS